MEFAIQNVDCGNILSYKWYANDTVFYVCNVKCLFKWFIEYFILFHCSSGNKEKLDFSVIY